MTPRYASSWSKSQGARGEDSHRWFGDTIHILNSVDGADSKQRKRRDLACTGHNKSEAVDVDDVVDVAATASKIHDETDAEEKFELSFAASQEVMPTNKIGFASHAVFALPSQLGVHEVLAPGRKESLLWYVQGRGCVSSQ